MLPVTLIKCCDCIAVVCLQYDWYTKQTSVVVDVVQRAREGMCMFEYYFFIYLLVGW